MMIKITGYVTKAYGGPSFTIKITDDKVEYEEWNHLGVSKEVEIHLNTDYHPSDNHRQFEKVQRGFLRDQIDRCLSISSELKIGDRVKCCVFIVDDPISQDGDTIYPINSNRNDVETYPKFQLWIYPNVDSFKRLEIDTLETLKFRRQNYYADVNNKNCERIIGTSYHQYTDSWWINKNPKITFPIRGWIKIRITVSNLWKRLSERGNLTIISIITNILLALITIWSLFFKDP